MKKISAEDKKLIKELGGKLKKLEAELVIAKKAEGIDDFLTVKVKRADATHTRLKIDKDTDKNIGKFYLDLDISAKKSRVFVPATIASGKKTTGFMYHIEGSGESSIITAEVKAKGEGIKRITLGTLEFYEIPAAKTATFRLYIEIKGKHNKTYRIVINRINYKLALGDARYQQYLKPIPSDNVKFS